MFLERATEMSEKKQNLELFEKCLTWCFMTAISHEKRKKFMGGGRGNSMLKGWITKWPNKTRSWDVTTNRPTQRALIISSNKLWSKLSRWHRRQRKWNSIWLLNSTEWRLFSLWLWNYLSRENNWTMELIWSLEKWNENALHSSRKHLCN